MFDSHCHLTDLDDPEQAILQALDAGVFQLLCCGYDQSSNASVLELSARWPRLRFALGLHPWYAHQDPNTLWPLLDRAAPVAIGECGLEGKPSPNLPSLARQRQVFEAQLDYAGRRGLPVVVHSRQAVSEVTACLEGFPGVRGVLHAYAGSTEQIHRLLERGWMVGIAGAVTRLKARRIHRLAKRLPRSAILLETDAPAIGLEGVVPSEVRPAHVVQVARAVALCREESLEEVVEATCENAVRLFGPSITDRLTRGGSECQAHVTRDARAPGQTR